MNPEEAVADLFKANESGEQNLPAEVRDRLRSFYEKHKSEDPSEMKEEGGDAETTATLEKILGEIPGIGPLEKMSAAGLFAFFVEEGCYEAAEILLKENLVPTQTLIDVLKDWETLVVGRPGGAIFTVLTGRYENPYDNERLMNLLSVLFKSLAGARAGETPLVYFDFSISDRLGVLFPRNFAREANDYCYTLVEIGWREDFSCQKLEGERFSRCESRSYKGIGNSPLILRAIQHIAGAIRDLPHGIFSTDEDVCPKDLRWGRIHEREIIIH